jgi:hypothetical protein
MTIVIEGVELHPPSEKALQSRMYKARISGADRLLASCEVELARVKEVFSATSNPGPRRDAYEAVRLMQYELHEAEHYRARLMSEADDLNLGVRVSNGDERSEMLWHSEEVLRMLEVAGKDGGRDD